MPPPASDTASEAANQATGKRADPADDPSKLRFVAGVDQQAGVLAWMPGTAPLQFVIVTSRRTGRWVFPKGSVDSGMTPAQAAAQEAFEEAGLTGVVQPEPFGQYMTPKIRPPLIWTVQVSLFTLRITEMRDSWQEMDQRQRKLVTISEAEDLLSQREMISLARAFVDGNPI